MNRKRESDKSYSTRMKESISISSQDEQTPQLVKKKSNADCEKQGRTKSTKQIPIQKNKGQKVQKERTKTKPAKDKDKFRGLLGRKSIPSLNPRYLEQSKKRRASRSQGSSATIESTVSKRTSGSDMEMISPRSEKHLRGSSLPINDIPKTTGSAMTIKRSESQIQLESTSTPTATDWTSKETSDSPQTKLSAFSKSSSHSETYAGATPSDTIHSGIKPSSRAIVDFIVTKKTSDLQEDRKSGALPFISAPRVVADNEYSKQSVGLSTTNVKDSRQFLSAETYSFPLKIDSKIAQEPVSLNAGSISKRLKLSKPSTILPTTTFKEDQSLQSGPTNVYLQTLRSSEAASDDRTTLIIGGRKTKDLYSLEDHRKYAAQCVKPFDSSAKSKQQNSATNVRSFEESKSLTFLREPNSLVPSSFRAGATNDSGFGEMEKRSEINTNNPIEWLKQQNESNQLTLNSRQLMNLLEAAQELARKEILHNLNLGKQNEEASSRTQDIDATTEKTNSPSQDRNSTSTSKDMASHESNSPSQDKKSTSSSKDITDNENIRSSQYRNLPSTSKDITTEESTSSTQHENSSRSQKDMPITKHEDDSSSRDQNSTILESFDVSEDKEKEEDYDDDNDEAYSVIRPRSPSCFYTFPEMRTPISTLDQSPTRTNEIEDETNITLINTDTDLLQQSSHTDPIYKGTTPKSVVFSSLTSQQIQKGMLPSKKFAPEHSQSHTVSKSSETASNSVDETSREYQGTEARDIFSPKIKEADILQSMKNPKLASMFDVSSTPSHEIEISTTETSQETTETKHTPSIVIKPRKSANTGLGRWRSQANTRGEVDKILFMQDSDGDTYLHLAISRENNRLSIALIESMKNESLDVQNKLGQTPLHLSVFLENLEVVKQLVDHGASVAVMDRNGDTPLHLACRTKNVGLVRYLMSGDGVHKESNGLQSALAVKNYEGLSPLQVAMNDTIQSDNAEILKLLLRGKADIDSREDSSGKTCLLKALEQKKFDLAHDLINRGADVDIASFSGCSPLHVASEYGDACMVERLIEKGASLYAKNVELQTPKDVAANEEIKQLLDKAMKKARRNRQKKKQMEILKADILDKFAS